VMRREPSMQMIARARRPLIGLKADMALGGQTA